MQLPIALEHVRCEQTDKQPATRSAGGTVLNAIAKAMPQVITGSADLYGSTKNYIKDGGDFSKTNPLGRNIWFGIREHAMGAICNGIAYDGIFRCSGATFLVFADYLRGSIRLAALSGLPVTYIFTHDSVGVGEDGPTHQPVETVSGLRVIPNLDVIRPGDAEEIARVHDASWRDAYRGVIPGVELERMIARRGPAWWHAVSVRLAYLPLDFVTVHEQLPEPSPVPAGIRVIQVPHGLFEISGATPDREKLRAEWGVRDGQKVFLAFGYVRDGKNLDLAIRALVKVPEAFLVVAGSVASANDKPFSFYRSLAVDSGVTGRCKFFEGFVADTDLGNFFTATDFVLLTYSSSFHSQSGVLNIAARARKPVLASASPGALVECVKKFKLGTVVQPDSADEVVSGMRQLLTAAPEPHPPHAAPPSTTSKRSRPSVVPHRTQRSVTGPAPSSSRSFR